MNPALVGIPILLLALGAPATPTPSPADHHQASVVARGDHVMGFDHAKTTHHFRLYRDGGAIDVSANDPADQESIASIRTHLNHIARMFSAGDFDAPMLIHDRVPPDVPVLRKNKDRVTYAFEPLRSGGRVRIRASDSRTLAAVHEFLRFQISDHRTGDSGEIEREKPALVRN